MPRLLLHWLPLEPPSNAVLLGERELWIAHGNLRLCVLNRDCCFCSDEILNTFLLAILGRNRVAKHCVLLSECTVIEEGALPHLEDWRCELAVESRVE